jgi:hypothetical protein
MGKGEEKLRKVGEEVAGEKDEKKIMKEEKEE